MFSYRSVSVDCAGYRPYAEHRGTHPRRQVVSRTKQPELRFHAFQRHWGEVLPMPGRNLWVTIQIVTKNVDDGLLRQVHCNRKASKKDWQPISCSTVGSPFPTVHWH